MTMSFASPGTWTPARCRASPPAPCTVPPPASIPRSMCCTPVRLAALGLSPVPIVSKEATCSLSIGKPARMRVCASLDCSMAPCMEPDLSMRNITRTSVSAVASFTAARAALSLASSSFPLSSLPPTSFTIFIPPSSRSPPPRAAVRVRHQPQLLERGRHHQQVLVGQGRQERREDGRRQAHVRGQPPHDLLEGQTLVLDALADLRLAQSIEALALDELEPHESHRAVARGRLLLLPAEHLEEGLRQRLVARLAGDALQRALVARLHQTLEQGRVLLARAQPPRRHRLPPAERRLAGRGGAKAGLAVVPGDLRRH